MFEITAYHIMVRLAVETVSEHGDDEEIDDEGNLILNIFLVKSYALSITFVILSITLNILFCLL